MAAETPTPSRRARPAIAPLLLLSIPIFFCTLAFRLGYVDVLWVDEAYPLAAAVRILHGDVLYRALWFDKPPFYAWVYLLWGAEPGWPLRVAGSLFATLCSLLAGITARRLFGATEAIGAALLLGYFLTFDHPFATVPLAPDLLTVPFALAAVWAAASGRGLLAGFLAGAALQANAKAFYLLAVVILWRPSDWRRTVAGYGAAVAAGLAVLTAQGALRDYLQQVWSWGLLYSRNSPLANPLAEAIRRTGNWAGFHAALVAGAAVYWWRNRDGTAARLAVWALLALGSIAVGWRFYPRYYFALLPAMTLAACRGLVLLPARVRTLLLVLLLSVPTVRFGARHCTLAYETLTGRTHDWRDLALLKDCQAAADLVKSLAHPGDSLFVWGYRPELNVLAGMPAANRFLDSQPLTGVFADRHLTTPEVSAPRIAQANRRELALSAPNIIVDGLGPYNPSLAITNFPDLRDWLADYELAGSTGGTRIYRQRAAR
jgi:hypothetical protein